MIKLILLLFIHLPLKSLDHLTHYRFRLTLLLDTSSLLRN